MPNQPSPLPLRYTSLTGVDNQALPAPSLRYRDGLVAGALSGVLFAAVLGIPSLISGLASGGNKESGNDYFPAGMFDNLVAGMVFLFSGLVFGLVIGTSVTLFFGSLIEKIHAKSDRSRWLPLWLVLWLAAMIGSLVLVGLMALMPSLFLLAPILVPCGALAGLIAAAVYMRKSKYIAHPWSIYFPNNLADTLSKQA